MVDVMRKKKSSSCNKCYDYQLRFSYAGDRALGYEYLLWQCGRLVSNNMYNSSSRPGEKSYVVNKTISSIRKVHTKKQTEYEIKVITDEYLITLEWTIVTISTWQRRSKQFEITASNFTLLLMLIHIDEFVDVNMLICYTNSQSKTFHKRGNTYKAKGRALTARLGWKEDRKRIGDP